MKQLAADLAAGFGLLTRLPVGWLVPRLMPYRPGRAVWTYPVAGLVVGGVAAFSLWLGRFAGLSSPLDAALAIAASVLLTGGLHEDGLADMADGFGGGRTRERRLEIMRDSRIGSYGALALVLSIAVRIAALAAIPGERASVVLLAAGALSRTAMLAPMSLPAARADGLGHSIGRIPWPARLAALAIALIVAIVWLPPGLALGSAVLAVAVGAGIGWLAWRRIGGQTGDVLGATCVIAECGLLALASR